MKNSIVLKPASCFFGYHYLVTSPVTLPCCLSLIGWLVFALTHDWLVFVFCGLFKAGWICILARAWMKFSLPCDHVTNCFLALVFFLECGTSFMFPCSVSTSASQTVLRNYTFLYNPMEFNLLLLFQGCQSGISLQSLVLSVEQNG